MLGLQVGLVDDLVFTAAGAVGRIARAGVVIALHGGQVDGLGAVDRERAARVDGDVAVGRGRPRRPGAVEPGIAGGVDARDLEAAPALGPGRRRGVPEESALDLELAPPPPVAADAGVLPVDRLGLRLRRLGAAVARQPGRDPAQQHAHRQPDAARLHRHDAGDGVPAACCSR